MEDSQEDTLVTPYIPYHKRYWTWAQATCEGTHITFMDVNVHLIIAILDRSHFNNIGHSYPCYVQIKKFCSKITILSHDITLCHK